jgi:hypothetical protein
MSDPPEAQMTDSEQFDLALYQHIKAAGVSRSATIGTFFNFPGTSGGQFSVIVLRLKDLRNRGCILLTKFVQDARMPYDEVVQFEGENQFFSGQIEIEIAPGGMRYFEDLESRAAKEMRSSEPKIIFISCGQSTETEIRLGTQIFSMVKSFGFEPFFAEKVQNLDGLNSSILRKLSECAAFITVLHPRGEVKTPKGETIIRASVWIEQEIAIASYIQLIEKRELPVIAFAHEDVSREGLRTLLHLNPIKFKTEQDVISKLPGQLNELGELRGRITLPHLCNFGGKEPPINISGKEHSAQGPFMVLSGLVTIVNPTQQPMRIGLGRLIIEGKERDLSRSYFRLKSRPIERFTAITLTGNNKEDYELHFVFAEADFPSSCGGELWLSIDGHEVLPVAVTFS